MTYTILSPETKIFVLPELLSSCKEEEFTLIHCDCWPEFDFTWINIQATTYLTNPVSQETLPLLTTMGILIFPQRYWLKIPGEHIQFTLVFDKIPPSWQSFDLIEPSPDYPFEFLNIKRNNTGVYRIKTV